MHAVVGVQANRANCLRFQPNQEKPTCPAPIFLLFNCWKRLKPPSCWPHLVVSEPKTITGPCTCFVECVWTWNGFFNTAVWTRWTFCSNWCNGWVKLSWFRNFYIYLTGLTKHCFRPRVDWSPTQNVDEERSLVAADTATSKDHYCPDPHFRLRSWCCWLESWGNSKYNRNSCFRSVR